MVYRSSRRQSSKEREPESFSLQPEDAHSISTRENRLNLSHQVSFWRTITLCLTFLLICFAIALTVILVQNGNFSYGDKIPTCGTRENYESLIDLSEPANPGPFHDLTKSEIQAVRDFIQYDPKIKAVNGEDARINNSVLYMMDLYLAKKSEILNFLDQNGRQPDRQARVIMMRGDLKPPQVEEYICGPLPKVLKCSLLKSKSQRNPVEFAVRPLTLVEKVAMDAQLIPKLEKKIGYILRESYGTSYGNCKPSECFRTFQSPIGTALLNNTHRRAFWMWAHYPLDYYLMHPTGFGVLIDASAPHPSLFMFSKVWYNDQLFKSTDEFVEMYNKNKIEKVKIAPYKNSRNLFSMLNQRGDPLPKKPQRPPTLVEPDGKRYTLKNKHVEYLGWTFNFRMSALTGPSLFDVKYKGERIVYELSLSDIAVFYSANNPMHSVVDFVDSGALIGSNSKSLVPGGDCPETATFINQTFSAQLTSGIVEVKHAFCLFENNNGRPLRRHLSFSEFEGAFYNGMLDSALVLRSALTIENYDYILDFVFHQNGVVETNVMSTGYIFPSFYRSSEKPYGFHIERNILGNIHHHMFHFKTDLDIGGTSNRYETLDIKTEKVVLNVEPQNEYSQIKMEPNLKVSEREALYSFNFDHPKYHVVHNNARRTKYDEIKAYRIGLQGMSKQLLPRDQGNERTIPWARHQLVVTKHKDDEMVSSSPYAMRDSMKPVTNFTTFYADDENIIDEDLVFWITQGMHHIPHTEDLPVTPTIGNHLTFFLFPYNYFDECPSMSSRDQIHIQHKDPLNPSKGVEIDRNGNSDKKCIIPQTATAYDQLLEEDPDIIIESTRQREIF